MLDLSKPLQVALEGHLFAKRPLYYSRSKGQEERLASKEGYRLAARFGPSKGIQAS